MLKSIKNSSPNSERGSTIAILAASMVFMIAMAAIAIDVVVLYVVRSEAQRAADAAALAGAHQFVTSGFTSGLVGQGQVCDGTGTGFAQQAAISVAFQNSVGGQPGVVQPADVQCDFSKAGDPRITVKVTRQNLPTFFSRIWGNAIVNTVSASATAEAYNASGNPVGVQSSCLKPFLLPNLDQSLPGGFITNGNIAHPGPLPGGDIGEELTLAPASGGDFTGIPAAGHFFEITFAAQPLLCPSNGLDCSSPPPDPNFYQANIQCCNTDKFTCGSQYNVVTTAPDATATFNGTQCMIHGQNWGSGADKIVPDPPLFQFVAGDNNPAKVGKGTPIATSDSLVTVPVFSAANPLCAFGCGPTVPVQVIGFLQLFVESVDDTGTMRATIINVVGCNTPMTGGPVSGGGISPIPVRLVQPGGGGN